MQSSSISHLRPDSLTGAVSAIEGIRGGCAVINGPTGCKYFTSYFVDNQDPRGSSIDPKDHQGRFYFGQPRAPSTYVDEKDYIYGAGPKLTALLTQLNEGGSGLIGIVNSPGMSLIGDDIAGAITRAKVRATTVVVESAGFTGSFAKGFQDALMEIVRTLEPMGKAPGSVNLIGPSIGHYNWEGDVRELKRLLELMSVRVQAVLTAGESLENIRRASSASLNVVVYEEYGDAVAELMEERFGIPSLPLTTLAPLGPAAIGGWVGRIAERLSVDVGRVEREMEEARRKCFSALVRASSVSGVPKGTPFAIFGDSSIVAPALSFLHDYLGMYPCLAVLKEVGEQNSRFVEDFLRSVNSDCTLLVRPDQYQVKEALAERDPEIIFGSSVEKQISRTVWKEPRPFVHIDTPAWGRVTLTHRPILGPSGMLTLTEDILNQLCPGAFST